MTQRKSKRKAEKQKIRRRVKRLEAFFGDAFSSDPFSVSNPASTRKVKTATPEKVIKKLTLADYYEKLKKRKETALASSQMQTPPTLHNHRESSALEGEPDFDFIDCDTSDIEFSPIKKNECFLLHELKNRPFSGPPNNLNV